MTNEEQLAKIIGQNISTLRRRERMTQAQLAEKLNYSDKSVSKWERGDGLPDICVLLAVKELFHVTLDDLCADRSLPCRDRSRGLILVLSVGLVFLVATVFFALLSFLRFERVWLVYIYALTASAIVGVVFTSLWWGTWQQLLSVSLLVWSIPLSLSLTFTHSMMYLLYIVAAVLQALAALWYWFRHERQKHPKEQKSEMPAQNQEVGS